MIDRPNGQKNAVRGALEHVYGGEAPSCLTKTFLLAEFLSLSGQGQDMGMEWAMMMMTMQDRKWATPLAKK